MKIKILQKILSSLVLLILLLAISACSASRKLAADFVNTESEKVAVLLLPSAYFDTFYEDAAGQLTSALNTQSSLLSKVSDSIFLEAYYNSFMEHLENNKIQLFTSDYMTDFLNFKGKSYLAEVNQMELVEYIHKQEVEELRAGVSQMQSIPLRALRLGIWLEVSAKDADKNAKYIYYAEGDIHDQVEGHFIEDFIRNDAIYHYQLDSLQPVQIYEWAAAKGIQHAEYMYDLMMNTYIWNQLSEKQKASYVFLHYNSYYKVVERADEAFEMLED